MNQLQTTPPDTRRLSHIGYAVDDIERAARSWATLVGAGPFLLLEDIQFDVLTYLGQPAIVRHDAAFGQWGPIIIELQKIHECHPAALAEHFLPGKLPHANHYAYVTKDPDKASEDLTAAGFPAYLHAQTGSIEVRMHDTRSTLGFATEIHRAGTELDELFGAVTAASRQRGDRPLRSF